MTMLQKSIWMPEPSPICILRVQVQRGHPPEEERLGPGETELPVVPGFPGQLTQCVPMLRDKFQPPMKRTKSPTSVRNLVPAVMGTLWALMERKMEAP